MNIGATNEEQTDENCHIVIDGADGNGGSVFGCNNMAGTPQRNVNVHIYKTGHNTTNDYTYKTDDGTNGAPTYAIKQV